jgi:glycosyltransferase involved in cell wall biosynthesis
MRRASTLVSVGLPVRNGADRIEAVVKSVLSQDHENLELVICDNASTDDTEDVCRGLAADDNRIVYHRNPVNIGIVNNFVSAMRLATGTFFRWVGDDDWLAPKCLSRCLDAFEADDRLILVTTQLEYTDPDGIAKTAAYDGTTLGSDDPVARFTEMLRLLTESYMLMDPLYGLFRRESAVRIERRNMLREDEVFATKLALAGPWGHLPEVLGRRNWKYEPLSISARRHGLPGWQVHFANTLQCREILRWLEKCDLDRHQLREAQIAVARMFMRRQRIVMTRRGRKLVRMARELAGPS